MIVVGGLTRLTDSGLSITEWRPVTGALPPSDDAAWTAEFDKYRATPQYEALNQGMTLDEFKRIYWWEWGHRQLGRADRRGLGARLPLVRRPPAHPARLDAAPPRPRRARRAAGRHRLVDGRAPASPPAWTRVASYRLAIHLGLAFVILGLIAWYVLRLVRPEADLLQARRQRNEP